MTDKDRFAPPVSNLGRPALGSLDVAAYPTGGQGIALDINGRFPANLHVPYVSSAAFSAGPPVSPKDGDIWIATGADTNGAVWSFRYNSGSSSSFKWEFFSGSPYRAETALGVVINTQNQVGATGFYYNGNMSYTTLRAGDYRIQGNIQFNANGAALPTFLQLQPFAGTALASMMENGVLTASNDQCLSFDQTIVGASASQSIGVSGHSGVDGTVKFANSKLHLFPVRVS